MTEPSEALDDLVHHRIRLGILTICHEAQRVEFSFLQESLGLTAGKCGGSEDQIELAFPPPGF